MATVRPRQVDGDARTWSGRVPVKVRGRSRKPFANARGIEPQICVSPLQCVAPIQSMSTIRVDPQGARCAHRDRTSGTVCSFAHIRRPFHGPAASRARATKSVSAGERRPEETLSDACEPFGSGMASGRAYRLIDLVSSSSIARTAAGIDESNVLTWLIFPTMPLSEPSHVSRSQHPPRTNRQ